MRKATDRAGTGERLGTGTVKRLLSSRPVEGALRGAALVVTDRRWAAPLSAAALGFGIFAGVAIGPGTAGSLATGAQQIIELPSAGDDGQSGGGGGAVASTRSAPAIGGGGGGGFEEALPPTPLAPEPIESLPPAATEPAPKAAPAEESEPEEEAEGQMFEGTVVHVSPAAGSYAMAIDGGELISIHAPELPDPGAKLSGPLRQLANGTYAEAAALELQKGTAKEVAFSGTVTFADPNPAAPAYTVSGRGSSLPVHLEPDPSGAVPELPAVGSPVEVTATIEPPAEPKGTPTLLQSKLAIESVPPATYLELAGIVKEVGPDTGQLLLSADWAGESESTLTLAVPPEIDSAKLELGDSYLATVEVAEDGSLILKGIASDERAKGADDSAGAQGDLKR
jgi:hypothetical protein